MQNVKMETEWKGLLNKLREDKKFSEADGKRRDETRANDLI